MTGAYTKQYFLARNVLDMTIAQGVADFAESKNVKKILDVGCGTGRLVSFLNSRGFKTYGCDAQKEALTLARKINQKKLITLTKATNLPYKNNSFDLVTAISVIEHLTKNEAGKFIAEARRVLKTNGFIFLVTPNYASIFRLIFGSKWFAYQDPTHITFFTTKSLSELLNQKGFKKPNTIFKVNIKKINTKTLFSFLTHSTPLANWRDSFWISAQKG